MKDESYNGWSNYETWCVSLWLDNEQVTYRYWRWRAWQCRERAKYSPLVDDGVWEQKDAQRYLLAAQLKEELEAAAPLQEASLYSDLLNAALSEVSWYEIAESILAENVEL